MKEVIWIFGPVASGKKIMMFEAANHQIKPSRLRECFGIDYKTIIVPLVLSDRTKDFRKKTIFNMMSANINAILLIQGQRVDWEKRIIQELHCKVPLFFNRCGYVFPDKKTYFKRRKCRNRPKCQYKDIIKRKRRDLKHIEPWFNEIKIIEL